MPFRGKRAALGLHRALSQVTRMTVEPQGAQKDTSDPMAFLPRKAEQSDEHEQDCKQKSYRHLFVGVKLTEKMEPKYQTQHNTNNSNNKLSSLNPKHKCTCM